MEQGRLGTEEPRSPIKIRRPLQVSKTFSTFARMKDTQQLAADLAKVRSYFASREIKNYLVVLTAIDPCIAAKGSRLRGLWSAKKPVAVTDADLIDRLCAVVEVMKDKAGV